MIDWSNIIIAVVKGCGPGNITPEMIKALKCDKPLFVEKRSTIRTPGTN